MKRVLFGLIIALALPGLLVAQTAKPTSPAAPAGQSLILEFVDGTGLTVLIGEKTLKYGVGITDGDTVPIGATLTTDKSTSIELRIKPNGTILKLAKGTTFTVQALAGSPAEKNTFALVAGKVRAIAAKGGNYDLKSQTAVCGVRGTDFAFSVEPGAKEELMVKNGLVDFSRLDDGGNVLAAIPVAAGELADTFAQVFQAAKFSADQFSAAFGDMAFQKLIETDVPGHADEIGSAAPAEQAPETTAATAPAGTTETKPVTAAEAGSALAGGASKLTKSDVESGFVKWLREVMGMELGSVTIDQTTYSKAVIQPNFNFGKVKLGLYLPIIYETNLFDPNDWYHPNGNDEWSFGFQKSDADPTKNVWQVDPFAAGMDFAADLALKVKFFELGRQYIDPFFIKVGNLNDLTLGHGLIMRNYANDTEFPAVRRVGFNVGMDFKSVGLELIASDLADVANGIYGTRFFVRPVKGFNLAFGISSVVDIAPFAAISKNGDGTETTTVADAYGDPMLVGVGVDLDLPIITSDLLSLRLFADAAAETTYLNQDSTATAAKSGMQWQLIANKNGVVSNLGAAGGLMGHVAMIDFRLEYRYFTGIFKPSLFDSTYDKSRAATAISYVNYAAAADSLTADTAPSVMGVYGEGGFSFLKDKLSFTFGYMWPWSSSVKMTGSFSTYLKDQVKATTDEFHARFVIRKGLIPIFDVSGNIFYDKKGLAQDLAGVSGKTFKLLDPYTTFGGEIVVPVPKTPNLDVAAVFSAVPSGKPDVKTGLPTLVPSISFETRLHF